MQCNSSWQATCFDIHCSTTSQMFAQSNQFQTQTEIERWIWISSLWDIMSALKNVPFEVALNGFMLSIGWFPKRQSHHQLDEWFHAINSCQLWNKAEVKSFPRLKQFCAIWVTQPVLEGRDHLSWWRPPEMSRCVLQESQITGVW